MNNLNKILFIPGLPRSGTTTLVNTLAQHPQILLPKIKEPHFFMPDKEKLFSFNNKGAKVPFHKNGFVTSWNAYSTNFNDFKDFNVFIDGSTLYSGFSKSLDLINNNKNIDPYFIILKRNPFNRALSHYLYSKSRGEEYRDFDVAINEEVQNKHPNWILKGYLQGSSSNSYEKIIEDLWGRNKLIVLDLEEGNVFSQHIFDKILNFLGLTHFEFEFKSKKNTLIYTNNKFLFQLRLFAKKIRQLSPSWFDNTISRTIYERLIVNKMNSDTSIYNEYQKFKKLYNNNYKN